MEEEDEDRRRHRGGDSGGAASDARNARGGKRRFQQAQEQARIERENAVLVRHMNDINLGRSKKASGFSYVRRANMSPMNRGDAAAATWRFV